MKRSRVALLAVIVLLSLLVSLVSFLPARWVVPLAQPRLRGLALEGVHGLVWDGAADRVRGADGRPLGALRWRLSRSLLWGRLDLRLDFQSARLAASGRLRRDARGRPLWSEATLRADLAAWAPSLRSALGEPRGTVLVTVRRAVLEGHWPVELDGEARWLDAAVWAPEGRVALGRLVLDFDGANGVLNGRLREEGDGPLRARGQGQASPLGWRLDLALAPRTADPALRHWLARLDRPAADGSIHLQRSGGLAAATTERKR